MSALKMRRAVLGVMVLLGLGGRSRRGLNSRR